MPVDLIQCSADWMDSDHLLEKLESFIALLVMGEVGETRRTTYSKV
jgi:hypothetical protein